MRPIQFGETPAGSLGGNQRTSKGRNRGRWGGRCGRPGAHGGAGVRRLGIQRLCQRKYVEPAASPGPAESRERIDTAVHWQLARSQAGMSSVGWFGRAGLFLSRGTPTHMTRIKKLL